MLAVPAIHVAGDPLWTPGVLAMGLVVGVFSSVLPYRLDIIALGRISPNIFGILQALAPAAAALAGWILLGELLGASDWVALAAVAVASAGATITSSARQHHRLGGSKPGDSAATDCSRARNPKPRAIYGRNLRFWAREAPAARERRGRPRTIHGGQTSTLA